MCKKWIEKERRWYKWRYRIMTEKGRGKGREGNGGGKCARNARRKKNI